MPPRFFRGLHLLEIISDTWGDIMAARKNPSAFDVEPGGLRTSGEIKILICYLLGVAKTPLLRRWIDQVFLEHSLANYFDVADALGDLVANGSIESRPQEGEEAYTLTESGRSSAALLETTLPFSVREKAVKSATRLLAKRRNERENQVLVEKVTGGYMVSCSVLDHELELMTVRLLVSDEMQVELLRETFLQSPLKVYQSVLSLMTGDNNLFGGDGRSSEPADDIWK